MRISDWSSDVCSSDLQHCRDGAVHMVCGQIDLPARRAFAGVPFQQGGQRRYVFAREQVPAVFLDQFRAAARSEEHTSELQSLMRISYAVFCLKKKKTTRKITNQGVTSQIVTTTLTPAHHKR